MEKWRTAYDNAIIPLLIDNGSISRNPVHRMMSHDAAVKREQGTGKARRKKKKEG